MKKKSTSKPELKCKNKLSQIDFITKYNQFKNKLKSKVDGDSSVEWEPPYEQSHEVIENYKSIQMLSAIIELIK